MHRTRKAVCNGPLRALVASALATAAPSSAAAQTPSEELDRIVSTVVADIDTRSVRGGEATISWHTDGPVLSVDLKLADELELPIVELAHHPEVDGGCTTVSRFEHSRRNRLGGRFAAVGNDPSLAVAELTADASGARHLRFAYRQTPDGEARLRLNLYDPDPTDHTIHYLDGRAFDSIRFWIRNPGGSPAVDIGIADAAGDTPIHVGTLDELATAHTGVEWRLVSLPLQEMSQLLDRSRLATLHLQPSRPGSGTIEIDNLSLCRGSAEPDRPGRTSAPAIAGNGKSLWVWHTSDLMVDGAALQELTAMVRRRGIDRVYLQLPSALTQAGSSAADNVALEAVGGATLTALEAVIEALNKAGAAVDALDGAASFALPENHAAVERDVAAVIRYNEAAPSGARFAGLHYDIEPYLLPGFGTELRVEIVAGYLTILERIAALAAPANLRFEVAIPFWFDSIRMHRPSTEVDGGLSFRVLSDAVIDVVDSVAIMDYRTRADGTNGTVALAASELEYASERGKRVRIGLETGFLPDQDLLRFEGEGGRGMPHGDSSRSWIVAGTSAEGARTYVVPAAQLAQLPATLLNDGIAAASVRHWQAARPVRVDARRLTFHDVGIERMRSVIEESTDQMRRYAAFEGFAIHYDRPYRRLLDRASVPTVDDDGRHRRQR